MMSLRWAWSRKSVCSRSSALIHLLACVIIVQVARRFFMDRREASIRMKRLEAGQKIKSSVIRPFSSTHEKQPSFMLACTVKDRLGYVRLLAMNMNWLGLGQMEDVEVHIFDNGSSNFTLSDLGAWFPLAVVHKVERRLKSPDVATRYAFAYFIQQTQHDVLVNIDSDMLLHPNWRSFILNTLPISDGFLSLYRTAAAHHYTRYCTESICSKVTVGAMGVVLTRALVDCILSAVSEGKEAPGPFDWAAVAYFNSIPNFQILVPTRSLALHYGLHGSHGFGQHEELSVDFDSSIFPEDIQRAVEFFLGGAPP